MIRVVGLLAVALIVLATSLLLHSTLALLVGVAAGAAGTVLLTRERPPSVPLPAAAAPVGGVFDGHALQPILDCVSEGVLLVGADDVVLVANAAAAEVLEREREAMEGVSLMRATRDHAFVQALRDGAGVPREVALPGERVIEVTASAVDLPPVQAVLTVRDLTLLRRAERARSDLVANISHELRTPITAARAIAETLESGVDEPEQQERFLGQLTGELEQLGAMVERLLRLSRLDAESEAFHLEPVDAGSLVASALARMRPVADRADVRLRGDDRLPRGESMVLADRERVQEVLTNLLDNAIRYTPAAGEVEVALELDGDMVRCSVRDQGPGILPPERRRVFERFYTADRARGDAGAGLGLAIARHIVSRLGGEIWVSDDGPGATLCFTLRRASAEDSQA